MAPGGAAEEAQTWTHHVCSQLVGREWSLLCKTWLCPSLQSSLLVQEGWQETGTVTQSTSLSGPERKCVNKAITHAIQLPPCLQPQGAELWHICEAYDSTEHHREKWENNPEKGNLLLMLHGAWMGRWEGSQGVEKSKCQHYLELANCWRDCRDICRMIVPGWMLRTTFGSIVILAISREVGEMPPGWALTENPPGICEWVHSFKNIFLLSNAPHIHHPGYIIDIVFALMAKPSASCCALC